MYYILSVDNDLVVVIETTDGHSDRFFSWKKALEDKELSMTREKR